MEKRKIQVVRSTIFYQDIQKIFDYGVETFGINSADAFIEDLIYRVECLSYQYEMHPECRFLTTPQRIYRNIILGSYLIIYRITSKKIEVLRAFHSHSSITKIRETKSIKI